MSAEFYKPENYSNRVSQGETQNGGVGGGMEGPVGPDLSHGHNVSGKTDHRQQRPYDRGAVEQRPPLLRVGDCPARYVFRCHVAHIVTRGDIFQ